MHRVTKAWDEKTAHWYKRNARDNWSKDGGDFDSAFASFRTTDRINVWNEVDITEVVKDFVKEPDKNFGVLLYMEVIMHTVEYASCDNNKQSNRPKLTIEIK